MTPRQAIILWGYQNVKNLVEWSVEENVMKKNKKNICEQ